eukprot:CAMPEP_0181374908 /NCGR_PEP_ID=MMETSP1106-20121128/16319_1 /TAXON_ID=81844 /ORGANISM="Mantoniella antarctica, Strain SL-175" /LENGTH=169 /DNA_ID=CAMNT_0023493017 /DNA_START=329 /DNA_END=839 /DNA_ORIENTATION=+
MCGKGFFNIVHDPTQPASTLAPVWIICRTLGVGVGVGVPDIREGCRLPGREGGAGEEGEGERRRQNGVRQNGMPLAAKASSPSWFVRVACDELLEPLTMVLQSIAAVAPAGFNFKDAPTSSTTASAPAHAAAVAESSGAALVSCSACASAGATPSAARRHGREPPSAFC